MRELQTVKKQSGFFGPPCIIKTVLFPAVSQALDKGFQMMYI